MPAGALQSHLSEIALPRLTFQSDPSENPAKSQFVK
jgi:hypothetical protein